MTDKKSELKAAEQRVLVERLAELADSGMPLPAGLKAAAAETRSLRLASQFRGLAKEFERGGTWDAASLAEANSSLPIHVLGAIRAGIRSGNLGTALNGLIDQDRTYRDVWRRLAMAVAYPLILLVFTLLLLVVAMVLIVRPMKEVFTDFGAELPLTTQMWIRLSNDLPMVLCLSAGVFLITMLAIRFIGGRVAWARFLSGIPVFGPMIHLAGVAQMLRLLEVMCSQQIPLAEALRLTSNGAADANMRFVTQWLSRGVEAGVPLSDLMDSTPRIPATIVPLIRWGEQHGAMGEALRSCYEMLEGSIQQRGSTVSTLLGPLMLIFVGVAIGMLAIAMFLPLVSLIQNLV